MMNNGRGLQLLSMELSPYPLSSRAKPRDLQFHGLFVEMFFLESAVEPSALPSAKDTAKKNQLPRVVAVMVGG
jgi:hypothetical protein